MPSAARTDSIRTCLWLSLAVLFVAGPLWASEQNPDWHPVTTVFHVHSAISTGGDSLDVLAERARANGIRAIFLTDNFLLRYEYGLFPFRGVIRRTVELPSVMQMGAGRFLSDIREANRRHPDVLLIPGVEVVPQYYWTGSVFDKNLTMHDAQKNLLVLGMQTEEDYVRLPAAGNYGSYRYGWWTLIALLPALLIPPAVWLLLRRVDRKVRVGWTHMTVRTRRVAPGLALLVLAGLLLANAYPFGSSPVDPYDREQGFRPHQRVIDYANERGGLAVWSMPEARDFNRFDYGRLGVVTVKTEPYPEALLRTEGYTAFGSVYQDTITVTNPAGLWDGTLLEFLDGRRRAAPWGIGEAAYHRAGEAGVSLEQVETVLWVREETPAALLEAVRMGRMYALLQTKAYGFRLENFSLTAGRGGTSAISGETLQAAPAEAIHLQVAVSATDGQPRPVPVQIVRSGRVVSTRNETVPFRVEYPDTAPAAGGAAYYRLLIGSPGNRIVSNPIFVRSGAAAASTR